MALNVVNAPRADDTRAINILDFTIYSFLRPMTLRAILLSLAFSL